MNLLCSVENNGKMPENVKKYEALYQEFLTLHDYFGRGVNDVMKRLRRIRDNVRGRIE